MDPIDFNWWFVFVTSRQAKAYRTFLSDAEAVAQEITQSLVTAHCMDGVHLVCLLSWILCGKHFSHHWPAGALVVSKHLAGFSRTSSFVCSEACASLWIRADGNSGGAGFSNITTSSFSAKMVSDFDLLDCGLCAFGRVSPVVRTFADGLNFRQSHWLSRRISCAFRDSVAARGT